MVKANSSIDEKIETLVQLRCLEGWTNGIHGELTSISALNIFLAVTAFLGNTLILVSLRKESSLRPPSKLLLRCLAATDLCVGVIAQPFQVIYWLSLVNKDWNLCPYALDTTFITGYTLTSVSMLTLTAISVDRLLALILGMRYKQVVTLTRTYAVVITFWFISTLAGTLYLKDYRITLWYGYIAFTVMSGNYHFLVCKNFPLTFLQPESNTYYSSTTTATKSIGAFEFMSIPKGSVRYSMAATGIGYMLRALQCNGCVDEWQGVSGKLCYPCFFRHLCLS